jgi:hypothetical protein
MRLFLSICVAAAIICGVSAPAQAQNAGVQVKNVGTSSGSVSIRPQWNNAGVPQNPQLYKTVAGDGGRATFSLQRPVARFRLFGVNFEDGIPVVAIDQKNFNRQQNRGTPTRIIVDFDNGLATRVANF